MNYLNKMTVKELREIAGRMDVYLQSKVKKDTIVFLIEARIENLHAEALEMNKVNETYTIPGTGVVITDPASVVILKAHEKAVRRFNPSFKRDKSGKVILTPKQRRRVHKNDRKVGKKIGLFNA